MARAQLPNPDLIRAALSISFLRNLAPATTDYLLRGALLSRVRAGDVFIVQAEEHRCAIVVDGLVRVFVALVTGHERTLREVEPGGAVGISAFSGLPSAINAQAVVDSHVLDIDPERLTNAAATESTLAMALLHEVSARLRDTEELMAAELGPIRQRLARRLLDLALESRDEPDIARVGHAELAEQLGCSREWVTKTLATLRVEGLIEPEARHRIHLLDPIGLHALARAWRTMEGSLSLAATEQAEVN